MCLFATNQRIVLTKADIAMPYTIRSVLGLCMAPLHSHVDPAGSVIHSHTIILIVTDVFDYVHHILWSWSHVGSMDTPPIATLPQCSSLDATIPPFLLKNDGNFTGIGEIVWLSEQRFASVSVKALASIATHHDKKGAVGSLVDRDQLITLEVKTFFYIAPHIVPASIHQGMGLSPPSIALERQQFLEIPGHTLFGVRSLFIEQEQQHDYLTFSTGYCCVMMELTRKLSSVQQQHYQPKVWLNVRFFFIATIVFCIKCVIKYPFFTVLLGCKKQRKLLGDDCKDCFFFKVITAATNSYSSIATISIRNSGCCEPCC